MLRIKKGMKDQKILAGESDFMRCAWLRWDNLVPLSRLSGQHGHALRLLVEPLTKVRRSWKGVMKMLFPIQKIRRSIGLLYYGDTGLEYGDLVEPH